MKKYKWLSETIIGTIITAFILACLSFKSDVQIEQTKQDIDIINNTEAIEYLQKTTNATHNEVTDIGYDLDQLIEITKTNFEAQEKRIDRLENIVIWKFNEQNKEIDLRAEK